MSTRLRDRILAVDRGKAADGSIVLTLLRADGPEFAEWIVDTGVVRPSGISTDGFARSSWVSADGRAVLHLADDHGNELGHIRYTPLRDPGSGRDLTPSWEPCALRGGDASRDGRHHVAAIADTSGFHLLLLDQTGNGDPRALYDNRAEAWSARISADGAYACIDTTDHNPGLRRFAITVIDTRTGDVVNRRVAGTLGNVTSVCFAPWFGDARILVTEYPDGAEHSRTLIWNPLTDESRLLDPAPDGAASVRGLDWHESGLVLLGIEKLAVQTVLACYSETARPHPIAAVPDGSFWSAGARTSLFDSTGDVLLAREASNSPLSIWRVSKTAAAVELESPAPAAEPARWVTFPSLDGTVVQGWLHEPRQRGPHPAVVHAHGGPHIHVADEYAPEATAWVEAGFVFLDVNYRGSTGRDRRFREGIWGDVGRLELEDLAAAHAYLVNRELARPDQILLTGESYGGYLTLYAMGRQPDLWAAGVADSAIGDWLLAYRDASPALRSAFRTWFAGSPEDRPELYRDRSPSTHARHVSRPVLVRQGRHDTRTPPAQLTRFVELLQDRQADIRVNWFDSGHGRPGVDAATDALNTAIDFARSIVGATDSEAR